MHALLLLLRPLHAASQTIAVTCFCPTHHPRMSLQEAVAGWAGYNHAQQRALCESALVAVHQGAWQQLEARMQAALQLLPYLADKP